MTNSVERDGSVIDTVTVRPKPDRRKQPRPPREAVAHRAYELHEQRGGEHGHDLDDWLRAEHELRARPSTRTLDVGRFASVHADRTSWNEASA